MPVNETILASAVYDQLQEALASDRAALMEIYRDYLADAWQSLQALREAVQQGQRDEVRAKAHSLKGSSLLLGARAVAESAAALESIGSAADLRGAEALLEQSVRALRQIQAELTSRLGDGVIPAGRAA
jgi:HPt (histidine-containing phosphotransfer) domain-containing protein